MYKKKIAVVHRKRTQSYHDNLTFFSRGHFPCINVTLYNDAAAAIILRLIQVNNFNRVTRSNHHI
jgi:hypothetical protein